MRTARFGLLFSSLFFGVSGWAQQTSQAPPQPASDPQAVALLNQSVSAFGATATVQSLELDGQVTSQINPGPTTGAAKLAVSSTGKSYLEMDLPSGPQIETTGVPFSLDGCQKTGPDGVLRTRSLHNCMVLVNRLLPLLTIIGQAQSLVATMASVADVNQPSIQLSCSTLPFQDPYLADPLISLTTVILTLDSKTGLPVSLSYNEHPENDAKTNVPTEVRYSNYQSTNGLMVPFRIQKYINGALLFEMNVQAVSLNPPLN